jgi:response regulator RpfG family c-di-GMP phosphodiesterase
MDVQMPEMDGLEATALIRSREPNGTRVPIVAMTAHAMKGDEEACLKSGMDGYLSKPVNQQLLHREIARVLERHAEASESERKSAPPAVAPESTATVQPEPSRRDRRRERMMELFRVEGPKMMAEIRAAMSADDASLLSRAAHKLCGAICYLSEPEAEMAARRVETLGREVRMEHAVAAIVYLEECLARIDPVFSSVCSGTTT